MVQGLAAGGTGEKACLGLGLAFGSCTAACGSSLAFDATRSRGATVLLLLPTPETCQQHISGNFRKMLTGTRDQLRRNACSTGHCHHHCFKLGANDCTFKHLLTASSLHLPPYVSRKARHHFRVKLAERQRRRCKARGDHGGGRGERARRGDRASEQGWWRRLGHAGGCSRCCAAAAYNRPGLTPRGKCTRLVVPRSTCRCCACWFCACWLFLV